MAVSAQHRSKFAALHRQWWRLHMSKKFSSGTETLKKNKQTNKQTTRENGLSYSKERIVVVEETNLFTYP